MLALLAAVFLWGTSFMATKVAIADFPPMLVIWLRMASASVLMVPFWPRVRRPIYGTGDWKWLLGLAVLEPCLYFSLEGYALQLTSSSQAGMISGLVPLFVAVGARAFFAEKMSRRAVIGLGLSLIGVIVLSAGGAPEPHAPAPLLGNALELAAMASGAGYMLVAKHLSSRYDPWFLAGLQTLAGAVFFLPAALLAEGSAWTGATTQGWLAIAYLGALVTLGALGLYNSAVAKMPAGRAALAINLIPPIAVIAGWLALGESLTVLQLGASAVILAGVMLGESGPKEAAVHPAAVEIGMTGEGEGALVPSGIVGGSLADAADSEVGP